MSGSNAKKLPRCPNGTRRNLKTDKCEPKQKKSQGFNKVKANTTKKSKKVYKYKVKAKPSAKSKNQKKAMQNELMDRSRPYQAHKKEQVVKKLLAKQIKANNLQRVKKSLKSNKLIISKYQNLSLH